MLFALLIILPLLAYFIIACEIRKPLQAYRKLSRELEKDLHNLFPFPVTNEPTHLDELWKSFSKRTRINLYK